MTRRLDYREGVIRLTPRSIRQRRLRRWRPGAVEPRAARVDGEAHCAALDAAARAEAHHVPRSAGADSAHGHPRSGCARRKIRGERDSGRSEAPMDSRHRARDQAEGEPRERLAQRRVCAALGRRRLDVRWRGCPRAGRYHVARKPAQLAARDRRRRAISARCRRSRRGDEQMGARIFRANDHQRLAPAT